MLRPVLLPILEPVLHFGLTSYRGGGAPWSLLEALSDPLLPMPSLIDGWTSGDFMGFVPYAPTAPGLPVDSIGNRFLEYTVTGAAGSSSLTIDAGNQSHGTGRWGGVVQHDDGTYGLHLVSNLASGTCTIWPNLRKDVTSGPLSCVSGEINGQHYSEPGYKALAHHVFNTTRSEAYHARKVAGWDPMTGAATDWDRIGYTSGQVSLAVRNNYIAGPVRANSALISRGRKSLAGTSVAAPHAGKGFSKTFDIKGHSGILEAFVTCANITAAGDFYPFHVVAEVDGVPFLDRTYSENDGLVRVFEPFPAGSTGKLTVTTLDETAGAERPLVYIDNVNWWVYDRVEDWTSRVIDINAKTVIIGDSWTAYYPSAPGQNDGVFGRELQSLMAGLGGTGQVVSVGQGGQTAEWGVANFDERVAPENPNQVVILFFTNDGNQYGADGYARWLTAMYKLGRKCQMIGARPIFIMPLPTPSVGQALRHGTWASVLGQGLPLES